LAHGEEAAQNAYQSAISMFGARKLPDDLLPSSTIPRAGATSDDENVPQTEMSADVFKDGIPCFKLFHEVGLAESSGAARRLIKQGGGYVNGRRMEALDEMITANDISGMEIVLRAGKKHFFKIRIKN
jgi:tyrosyl-tRNA synthetase